MYLFVLIELFFTLMVLAWSGEAKADADWLALNPGAGNVLISMDKNSVVLEASKVMFWEKVEFAQAIEIDEISGRMIKFKRVQRMMDCAAKTQGVLRGSTFGENNKLIEAIMLEPAHVAMRPIQPGTIAELQFRMVCEKSAPVFEPEAPRGQTNPDPADVRLRMSSEMDSPPTKPAHSMMICCV